MRITEGEALNCFVRHGRPQIDRNVPASEWKLSAAGQKATISLASELRHYSFDHLVSSPEPKALSTAEILASQLGSLTVEIDGGFSEHARRSVGFLSAEQLDAGISRLLAKPDERVFGEETANEAYRPICSSLWRQSVNGTRNLMVVTHGTILTIYVSRLLGIDALSLWRKLPMPGAIILQGKKMLFVGHE
jgi:broad specificity phosphatase PhoE